MTLVALSYTLVGYSTFGSESGSIAGVYTDISSMDDSMMTSVLEVLWDIVCYSF